MAVQTQLYAVPEIEKKESKEQNELENEKIFETKSLNLWYGETQALKNIELEILRKVSQRLSVLRAVGSQHLSKP